MCLALLLLSLSSVAVSLNILFYVPTLSYSHVAFNAELAHRLIEAGHQVTMIQAVVDESVAYNSSRFEIIRKYVGVAPGEAKGLLWSNPGPFEEASPLDSKILWKLFRISNLFVKICGALMEDLVFLEDIRSKNFDIGFVEQYDSCGFGFFSAAGISRVSWLSATLLFAPQSAALGVPQPLSHHPELFLPSNGPLSFWNRIRNVVVSFVTSTLFNLTQIRQNFVFKDLRKAASQMSHSLLVNTSPLFDLPFPQSAEFRHIAGITVSRGREQLDQTWKRLVRERPFVLVSFGSIARFSDMPPEMRDTFLRTFSLYPNVTFFLKWEDPSISLPLNVFAFEWLPQKALIAHHNFRAMITHGGWSSILEVVTASRPLLLTPLFADHWRNSHVVAHKGVGIVLDKTDISTEGLASALDEVLFNSVYTLRARRVSSMLHSPSPISPSEQLQFSTRRSRRTISRPRDTLDYVPFILPWLLVLLSY